jgi:hypothetical protein
MKMIVQHWSGYWRVVEVSTGKNILLTWNYDEAKLKLLS